MLIFIIGIGLFIGAKFGIFNGLIISLVLLYFFRNKLDSGFNSENGASGHSGFNKSRQKELNSKFIKNIFGLFGKMAKAKGIVEKADLNSALNLMRSMNISPEDEELAKSAFNKGKEDSFDFKASVYELKKLFATNHQVLQMVLEILVSVALIDGDIDPKEKELLKTATNILGFSNADLDRLIQAFQSQTRSQSKYSFEDDFKRNSGKSTLDMAYEILELNKNATQTETKKQYKRMISKNHPDKLIAKKMPEKIIQMAKEKTQKINQAYELICREKGWN